MSATTTRIEPGTYNVDPAHSNVGFAVKHMAIATVRGAFKSFNGTVEVGEGLELSGSVNVASVDTGDAQRDGHLQTPDFFDVEQFPQITFKSTTVSVAGEDLTLNGEITIKGITEAIEFKGSIVQGGKDPWGHERVGFEVESAVDRRKFGLNFNQDLPGGGLLVANNVKLIISVSAVKA